MKEHVKSVTELRSIAAIGNILITPTCGASWLLAFEKLSRYETMRSIKPGYLQRGRHK